MYQRTAQFLKLKEIRLVLCVPPAISSFLLLGLVLLRENSNWFKEHAIFDTAKMTLEIASAMNAKSVIESVLKAIANAKIQTLQTPSITASAQQVTLSTQSQDSVRPTMILA